MLGLCDVSYCKRKATGYVETEFGIPFTGMRFLSHIDLCTKCGHLIPIQIIKYKAVSIDNVSSLDIDGRHTPLYEKYWKAKTKS